MVVNKIIKKAGKILAGLFDYRYNIYLPDGGVAQVVRARGSYPRSHWFESSHRHFCFLLKIC